MFLSTLNLSSDCILTRKSTKIAMTSFVMQNRIFFKELILPCRGVNRQSLKFEKAEKLEALMFALNQVFSDGLESTKT